MRLGLSIPIVLVLALVAVAVFLALAWTTKWISGEERLVFYHHEIAILAVVAAMLQIGGLPVLPYLDVTAIGIGVFLAFGRIGCFMVGCCHGGPHRVGVCYNAEHAADGFGRELVGVRVLPVQLLESVSVAAISGIAAWLAWRGAPPGTALCFYAAVYAVVRFVLEFIRGDAGRKRWLEFTEAQWISCTVLALAIFPRVPAAAGLPLLLAIAGWVLSRRKSAAARFAAPAHVIELAGAMKRARRAGRVPRIAVTSMGVRVSSGETRERPRIVHYTLSAKEPALDESAALRLFRILLTIDGRSSHEGRLICGENGVFHLVVPVDSERRYA